MPKYLPDELSHMKDIQHAINLALGSQLLNVPHYRMNPMDRAELSYPIKDLLAKDFIFHSLTHLVIPALFSPKKDGALKDVCKK